MTKLVITKELNQTVASDICKSMNLQEIFAYELIGIVSKKYFLPFEGPKKVQQTTFFKLETAFLLHRVQAIMTVSLIKLYPARSICIMFQKQLG